ncbi:MAG TPA: sigma-70 family RNA polymerase sigma factor [Polyangiaceae bacterium]|nr:sigma-70 family RNA polymerase sigma factor [Polyangiaceae bacterium]
MGELGLAIEGPRAAGALPKPGQAEARARALVAEHFDFVWRLLRRLGVPESDADDAAQQVFIVGTRRLADIPLGNERTFLYGSALRVAATFRRSAARRERFIRGVPAEPATQVPTPHDEIERRQALAVLDRLLSTLADDLREVFVLCEIEELTAPAVAAIIGVPVGTVSSRLRRARHSFTDALERLKAQGK